MGTVRVFPLPLGRWSDSSCVSASVRAGPPPRASPGINSLFSCGRGQVANVNRPQHSATATTTTLLAWALYRPAILNTCVAQCSPTHCLAHLNSNGDEGCMIYLCKILFALTAFSWVRTTISIWMFNPKIPSLKVWVTNRQMVKHFNVCLTKEYTSIFVSKYWYIKF